jgi:hypothetical protein
VSCCPLHRIPQGAILSKPVFITTLILHYIYRPIIGREEEAQNPTEKHNFNFSTREKESKTLYSQEHLKNTLHNKIPARQEQKPQQHNRIIQNQQQQEFRIPIHNNKNFFFETFTQTTTQIRPYPPFFEIFQITTNNTVTQFVPATTHSRKPAHFKQHRTDQREKGSRVFCCFSSNLYVKLEREGDLSYEFFFPKKVFIYPFLC